MTIHEILKTYWGYSAFRPLQEEIIQSVMDGNDTLALLPTGGGKSICFQVPAMAMHGICIVISPLIALMKDQVEHLKKKGIPAAAIVSGMSKYETDLVLNNSTFGNMKFLYVSPERLANKTFIEHFKQMKVGLIAVDEAHCISQWGYDFRPPYLEIARVRAYHPQVPLIALTATATPEVVYDIQEKLAFQKNKKVFQKSFFRENLTYIVFHEEDKLGRMLRIIRTVKGSGIVYVRNRKQAQEIARYLVQNGISSSFYHAGLSTEDRDTRQRKWMNGTTSVMVATNAFGMGIDKPDVRFVIHLDLPDSPEAYFQEAGRGGRDEKQAYAILLYHTPDINILNSNFELSYPSLQYIRNVYRGICNFYRIPIGMGVDQRFDFDPIAICETYNFQVYPFFSALRFLEKEGMLMLPEKQEIISKIYIPVSRETLYNFQIANKRFDDFLKLLLRMYGGLFSNFIPIHENEIARRFHYETREVEQLLEKLHEQSIIVYEKKSTHPKIIFSMPRIEAENLYINDLYYNTVKENAKKRKDAMIHYVQDNTFCRSSALLHYFGEENEIHCTKCDVCIAHRKKEHHELLKTRIRELLTTNPATIKQLVAQLAQLDEAAVIAATRELIDYGTIELDSELKLRIRK